MTAGVAVDGWVGSVDTPRMDKFRIQGGPRLTSRYRFPGEERGATCLAATLLTCEPVRSPAPHGRVIVTMEKVLQALGESCQHRAG